MNIEDVIDTIRNNRIRITDHADVEAEADKLSFDQMFVSVLQGEITKIALTTSPIQPAWSTAAPLMVIPCIRFGHTMRIIAG